MRHIRILGVLIVVPLLRLVTTICISSSFRTSTLTFLPGQTSMRVSAVILEDEIPEDTEVFSVELKEPRGGAEIGPDRRVTISILSNDNAHGVIEFAEV